MLPRYNRYLMRPFLLLLSFTVCQAQQLPIPHPIPPPGIPVSAPDRAELEIALANLSNKLGTLRANPLYADAAIYAKAVRFALDGNEFHKPEEIPRAKELLKQGQARADALAAGKSPWTTATGLVVRAYISKLDGSVQPYGLVIPPSRPQPCRLDTWFHGRNENLSELNFIVDRQKNRGEFTPKDTIVLHLYGRYNNASKFAGESDFFEALDDVKKHYRIDENRIVVRGFSMGGASVWHIAAHYAGLWAAAAPGAGFAETAEYQKGKVKPTWYEEKLWHLTNATDYALNLSQLPVIAYNGEIDPQKQAADIMARYMAEEGLTLKRVVGPGTAHKYHPQSKIEIDSLIDPVAERGRDPNPKALHFTTFTLRYHQMRWITLDGLEQHWERAKIDAERQGATVTATTRNISALTFEGAKKVTLDGQPLAGTSFHKKSGKWVAGPDRSLHKQHDLQGPIDDAFLNSFLIVNPTGRPKYPQMAELLRTKEAHALQEWRGQWRGEAKQKNDTEITDADIRDNNLILWGDEGSNLIYKKIAAKLPLKWPAADQALVMIYPNPLNRKKYIVLNSGVTFAEDANASNSLQTAKLPDWAVMDGKGRVLDANFFDERWQVKPGQKK